MGPSLAQRLRQYTSGTFAGIFSQQSNVEIDNHMVVFNIRDLEDELRPVAMYIVLNHIWSKVRAEQRRRILIVDEAWQLMKYLTAPILCSRWLSGLVSIIWVWQL